MRKSGLFLTLIVSIILSSCYRPSPRQAFEDMKELNGAWTSYEGVQFNENWWIVNDSLMKGVGYSMKGSDTAFSEYLSLKRVGDSVYYGALVPDNNVYIYFNLNEAYRNKWVFINQQHDYPNIITYDLKNDTLLTATTSNIRGNKKIEFKLKKVQK